MPAAQPCPLRATGKPAASRRRLRRPRQLPASSRRRRLSPPIFCAVCYANPLAMKRFWDQATIEPRTGEPVNGGSDNVRWRVLLDGKPVQLPNGTPLMLSRRGLAEAIAAEWQLAGGAKGGEMYAD